MCRLGVWVAALNLIEADSYTLLLDFEGTEGQSETAAVFFRRANDQALALGTLFGEFCGFLSFSVTAAAWCRLSRAAPMVCVSSIGA
jgi:hypothetical protein